MLTLDEMSPEETIQIAEALKQISENISTNDQLSSNFELISQVLDAHDHVLKPESRDATNFLPLEPAAFESLGSVVDNMQMTAEKTGDVATQARVMASQDKLYTDGLSRLQGTMAIKSDVVASLKFEFKNFSMMLQKTNKA